MKYLCLAYRGGLNALSAAEWDLLRRETLAYVETLMQDGRLLLTQALQSVRTAATLRVRGGKLSVTDGPFAETKEMGGLLPDRGPRSRGGRSAGCRLALGAPRQHRGAARAGGAPAEPALPLTAGRPEDATMANYVDGFVIPVPRRNVAAYRRVLAAAVREIPGPAGPP
jgi:hypothetical protein